MNFRTVIGIALVTAGCSDGPTPTGGNPASTLGYSNAAVMAVAIATAHHGTGPFDNSLGCARRGVVEYVDNSTGRQAIFTGCDTGNDVVLDGTVTVTGLARDADPALLTTLNVSGGLRAKIGTGASELLQPFTIAGIAFETGTTPVALRLRESSVRVKANGAEFPLDSRTSAESIIDPPNVTIGRLPNPTGGVDVLTEVDMRRIAVHDLIPLALLLLSETLESARDPHSHTLNCGTTDVAPDAQKPAGYVRLTNAWTSCVIAPGFLVSGNFQLAWDTFSNSRLAMRVTGPVTLGGGLPITTFSLIEWTLEPSLSLPGNGEIFGRLVVNGVSRSFRFTVALDD